MLIAVMTFIHVTVCIFLILVVLLQTGKGSDIAAAFGGSSQTAFGARGATTFLSKLTTGAAVLFMITSMTLALVASGGSSSVVDSVVDDAGPAAMEETQGQLPSIPGGDEQIPPAGAGDLAPADEGTQEPGEAPGGDGMGGDQGPSGEEGDTGTP